MTPVVPCDWLNPAVPPRRDGAAAWVHLRVAPGVRARGQHPSGVGGGAYPEDPRHGHGLALRGKTLLTRTH
jgi:hypothetical protein